MEEAIQRPRRCRRRLAKCAIVTSARGSQARGAGLYNRAGQAAGQARGADKRVLATLGFGEGRHVDVAAGSQKEVRVIRARRQQARVHLNDVKLHAAQSTTKSGYLAVLAIKQEFRGKQGNRVELPQIQLLRGRSDVRFVFGAPVPNSRPDSNSRIVPPDQAIDSRTKCAGAPHHSDRPRRVTRPATA